MSPGVGWNSWGSTSGPTMGTTATWAPPTLRAMSVVIVESEATVNGLAHPLASGARARANRSAARAGTTFRGMAEP